MGKYLVTGAAGFIGSKLAGRLLSMNHEVFTIDNLSTGYKSNLPKGIRFIKGDCQDQKVIDKLNNKRFDAIFHFAGQSSGEISFEDPIYDLRTNTESIIRLIEYGLKTNCKRFIYASSMSVYGEVNKKVNEIHSTNPLSFYGVGKLASEKYLKIYESKGLKFTALRLFNIYGPGQNMNNKKQGMVSIFLDQLLNDSEIVVKGSLDRYRDFVYIDDCVDVIIEVLNNNKTIGKIYNIGTGVKTTIEELLFWMFSISNITKKIIVKGNTEGDQKGIYSNSGKFFRDTGYRCKTNLFNGLTEMIRWAKENKNEM